MRTYAVRDSAAAQSLAPTPVGPLPSPLRTRLETASGFDLSRVRVHRDSPFPAVLDADAFTAGRDVHLGPGGEQHLPHETWHAVQQMQGRVAPGLDASPALEAEADRVGASAWGSTPAELFPRTAESTAAPALQRKVRIGGGATKVRERDYLPGGAKASVGTKRKVASLIADDVKRVFDDVTELEAFANGTTDFLGDVITTNRADPFWFRVPKSSLTVLGEQHSGPAGNFEDVVRAFGTTRFMYEPFNELVGAGGFSTFTGTQARIDDVNATQDLAGFVDRTNFDPDLENAIVKALTGAALFRNEFVAKRPARMDAAQKAVFGSRASTSDWSFGERIALYFSMAIHIAADLAAAGWPPRSDRSRLANAARDLVRTYKRNAAVLDAFMAQKDADDLIGIYELTAPDGFRNLRMLTRFADEFHVYGSRYVQQLGADTGNRTLQREGRKLERKKRAGLDALNPVREEMMWQKVQVAKAGGYLLVGMGDAHREHLASKLDAAGIPHERVDDGLKKQEDAVKAAWVP